MRARALTPSCALQPGRKFCWPTSALSTADRSARTSVDAGVGYVGPVQGGPDQNWSLRAAVDSDALWIAELRALVLRPDLERLGRFDAVRVRQRFLSAF